MREAERGPVRAADELEEELEVEREVRSLRMALDWRRAELKRVFMAVYWCDTAQSDSNVGGNERRCTKYVQ